MYRADLLVAPGATESAPEQLRGAASPSTATTRSRAGSCPRHALRELGIDPDGYVWVRTGSHRNSLRALLRGEVEAAPIDSTVLALELRAEPALAALRSWSRGSAACRARRSRSSAATPALARVAAQQR